MIDFEDSRELVGMQCSFLYPWRGYTEGTIIEEYVHEVLVQVASGSEVVMYRSDVSLCL